MPLPLCVGLPMGHDVLVIIVVMVYYYFSDVLVCPVFVGVTVFVGLPVCVLVWLCIGLAPVVQRVDNAIHWINCYLVDKC